MAFNSLSADFIGPCAFESHATLYDWPMYRAIGRLRTSESDRVAAPLVIRPSPIVRHRAQPNKYYERYVTHQLKAPAWPEEEGSQEGGRQSTEELEEELYRKLYEDGGKKMIFKMARDKTEDGRDVKRGAVIKDHNGRLITESKEVLRIWAANFKELLNGKGASSCIELPSSVRREVGVEEIGQEEVETAMHKMKKDKATEADEVRLHMLEMAGEVGVKWK